MVLGAIFLLLLSIVVFRYVSHALRWRGFPGLSPFRSLPMVGHAYVFRKRAPREVLDECRYDLRDQVSHFTFVFFSK